MIFKLFMPFSPAWYLVCATHVFNFPAVIHRVEIQEDITVHEYNATAADLGAVAMAPKLESRGSLEERSTDCIVCKCLVTADYCIAASQVRYAKINTDTDVYTQRKLTPTRLPLPVEGCFKWIG